MPGTGLRALHWVWSKDIPVQESVSCDHLEVSFRGDGDASAPGRVGTACQTGCAAACPARPLIPAPHPGPPGSRTCTACPLQMLRRHQMVNAGQGRSGGAGLPWHAALARDAAAGACAGVEGMQSIHLHHAPCVPGAPSLPGDAFSLLVYRLTCLAYCLFIGVRQLVIRGPRALVFFTGAWRWAWDGRAPRPPTLLGWAMSQPLRGQATVLAPCVRQHIWRRWSCVLDSCPPFPVRHARPRQGMAWNPRMSAIRPTSLQCGTGGFSPSSLHSAPMRAGQPGAMAPSRGDCNWC